MIYIFIKNEFTGKSTPCLLAGIVLFFYFRFNDSVYTTYTKHGVVQKNSYNRNEKEFYVVHYRVKFEHNDQIQMTTVFQAPIFTICNMSSEAEK